MTVSSEGESNLGKVSDPEIAQAIQESAEAFLKRQYTTITIMTVLLAIIILCLYLFAGKLDLGIKTSVSFILGAFASGLAGFIDSCYLQRFLLYSNC